jgi:diphosphomevalonate decarboxylase
MKKQTAIAPANIACIKYWGKENESLRIPLNDSLSMNLSGAYTTTTVEFSDAYRADDITLLGGIFSDAEVRRVREALDAIRVRAGIKVCAKVRTENTFPKGAGAAASASGFAALTVAAVAAAGLSLSEKELTTIARLGSGSACRSIPGGFVVWEKGTSSDTSYAYSLYPHSYWDLRDLLVIVDAGMKKVSTSDGMKTIATSPALAARLIAIPDRMRRIQQALKEKNFSVFGQVMEEDCLDMHTVMQTQVPPILYWNDKTRAIMDAVRKWRAQGLDAYFTIDAGPNVHIICEGKNEAMVLARIQSLDGVQSVIPNTIAAGAHLIGEHLF